MTCDGCSAGCATCFNSTNHDCLSCNNFNTSTAYYKWANQSTCDYFCPDGQFISPTLSHQCAYCASNCITCTGRADNCTSTGGCRTGSFFSNSSFNCVTVCSDGEFGSTSNNFCMSCDVSCALCFGPSALECSKCRVNPANSSEPYFKLPFSTQCNSTCPVGWFEHTSTYTCEPCHSACSACGDNATDCSACQNVTGIAYYNLNSTCWMRCPDGTYGDDSSNTCLPCDITCLKCSAAGPSACSVCGNNGTADFFLVYGSSNCSDVCPDGQFSTISVTSGHLCRVCNSECLTCDLSSSNCTSCGRVNGVWLFLQNFTCVAVCSAGTYMNSSLGQCVGCADGCLTCNGPSTYDCQSCNLSSNSTPFYKFIGEDTCGSDFCPPGQYINVNVSFKCQACSSLCQ